MSSAHNTQDRFELRVFFKTNPLESWETARAFLETLRSGADFAAPTIFWKRHDKGEALSIEEIKAQFRRESPDVLFFTNENDVSMEWAGFQNAKNPASKLLVRIPFSLLGEPEHVTQLLELTSALCASWPPVYGWGHSEEDGRLGRDPHITNPWAPLEVKNIYWLTILGSAMVRKLKRAHVASTPADKVEILNDGSALIVTSPSPNELFSPEAREAQAKALAHLRPDINHEQVLKKLLEQSEKLKAVERNWDPGFSPIFQAIVEAVPLTERRAKEVELSAYSPKDVKEWRPASEASPSDVDDSSAMIDSYHRQGETFIAGFHNEIPRLVSAEPDALPWIDVHFYLRDYARQKGIATVEKLMLPTLGAHLGNMLEFFLDGKWIPRRNLEESQVIVGERVWLPFLRVKRFIESKQAALDFSLWQFYREAQQHAPNAAGTSESPTLG
jgi:hypothetical protein